LSKQKLLKREEDVRKRAKIGVPLKKQIQPVCSSLNLDRSKYRKEEENVMSSKENEGACGLSEPSVSNIDVGNNEESITLDMSFDVFSLDAGLLARGQYSEGPATDQLDTGFSWFSRVFEQMLSWFRKTPSCHYKLLM
jgi:hypothetical protein